MTTQKPGDPTPEELAQQIKDAEAKADILFPPKPGVELPKTMREFFERVFGPDGEPEEGSGHFDELHARVAKNILRRQAGELVREECFDSIAISPEGAEPWSITVAFRPGELSREAQLTLEKMKHNSHKSQLGTTKGITGVSFIVYSTSHGANEKSLSFQCLAALRNNKLMQEKWEVLHLVC